jgi:RHS repeat-associated protein
MHPPSKNRVGGFSAVTQNRTREIGSQVLEPQQEKSPPPTEIASGVHYYGYRYYNPELGRWINRDPLGEIRLHSSVHPSHSISDHELLESILYVFVINNPVSNFDFSGLYTLRSAANRWADNNVCAGMSGLSRALCRQTVWNNLSDQLKFDFWYEAEIADTSWILSLSDRKCPARLTKCLVGTLSSPVSGGSPVLEIVTKFLNPDSAKWHDPALPNWRERNLHPGGPSTIWSMRSKPVNGHANQCIYDDDGILIRELPTAGTVDFVRGPSLGHYRHDVEPIYLANKLDGGTSDYGLPNSFPQIRLDVGMNAARYFEVRPLYAE